MVAKMTLCDIFNNTPVKCFAVTRPLRGRKQFCGRLLTHSIQSRKRTAISRYRRLHVGPASTLAYINKHTCSPSCYNITIQVEIYTYIHTFIHTYIPLLTHTHTHGCMYTHTHTHLTHSYILKNDPPP